MTAIDLALFAKLGAVIAATVLGLVCLWALLPRYQAKVYQRKRSNVAPFKPIEDSRARDLHRLMKGQR